MSDANKQLLLQAEAQLQEQYIRAEGLAVELRFALTREAALYAALVDYPGVLDDSALFAWERRVVRLRDGLRAYEDADKVAGLDRKRLLTEELRAEARASYTDPDDADAAAVVGARQKLDDCEEALTTVEVALDRALARVDNPCGNPSVHDAHCYHDNEDVLFICPGVARAIEDADKVADG